MHTERELINAVTDSHADTDNRRQNRGGVDNRTNASRGFRAEHRGEG